MSKLLPIADPVAHARQVTGYEASVLTADRPWGPFAAFHTTGEFERTGEKVFHQHCGPTAITNVICTLERRRGMVPSDPAAVFRRVSDIGRRRLTYWNIHEKVHLGGTSYLLLQGYVARCLREFGIQSARVRGHLLASPEQMASELGRGRLLVLSMTRHRCYGSHLVTAYGAVRVAVEGRGKPRLYLLVADGWAARPRYIAADTLGLCGYVAVEV